jgi:membrane fusion protein, multidrug efflux system
VEQRRVSVGRSIGDRWVISEGLKDGDRVVAEGFQKTAPGAKVKPEPWSDEADVATAADSESAAPAAKQ